MREEGGSGDVGAAKGVLEREFKGRWPDPKKSGTPAQ